MKLCYNQATTMRHSTLEEDLQYCEKYGYDLIEMRIDKLKDYLTRHSAQTLADFFKKSRIKPYAFNGLEEFNYRSAEDFAGLVADMKLCCSLADLLDCHMLTMDPRFDAGHLTNAQIREDTKATVMELFAYAENYGMKFAFEFCGGAACCINNFGSAWKLVQAVDRPDFGVILDFFHFHAMASKLEDLRKADIEKIFMVHINDAEDYPIGQLGDADRLWPGEGVIDIDGIMGALLEMGYDGVYSLELFRPEYWEMPTEDVIRIGKEKSDVMLAKYYGNKR